MDTILLTTAKIKPLTSIKHNKLKNGEYRGRMN